MEYTIQELAKSARVSVRTLRYYDEIGLLMPSVRMANGRHKYGVDEIMTLVHILSLRELGFGLKKIQTIMGKGPLDKVSALGVQKKILIKEQERLKINLQRVDSMIAYYRGESKIDPEVLKNFRSKQEYQKYFEEGHAEEVHKKFENHMLTQVGSEYYEALKKKAAEMDLVGSGAYGRDIGMVSGELLQAGANGLKEDCEEVQTLVEKHWEILQRVYPETQSKKIYFAIRDQLCGHESLEFIHKAMTVFGEKEFT